MKRNTISFLVKISICLIAAVGIWICYYWIPLCVFLNATQDSSMSLPALIFYYISAIPCFAVLGIAWSVSNSFKDDTVFSTSTVKKLMLAYKVLFADSCFFIIGNLTLLLLKVFRYELFGFVFLVLGILALIISFGIYVLATYISKAQLLKEDSESIL